jgi:hypothetical protein
MINTKELKSFEEVQAALSSGERVSFGLRFWGETVCEMPQVSMPLQLHRTEIVNEWGDPSERFVNQGIEEITHAIDLEKIKQADA